MKNLLLTLLCFTLSSVDLWAVPSQSDYLESQGIILQTPGITQSEIATFLREFQKFPRALHHEIISNRGRVHLIKGRGVTADPTWVTTPTNRTTTYGTSWSTTAGSGGAPYARVPTRIVVNMLRRGHDTHGATNLFLHEHAHSLDSVYKDRGVSKSRIWARLMLENPSIAGYLRVCGSYCNNNERERFAELFSLYHHSELSREEMEMVAPAVAEFFKNLSSVRNISRNRRAE